MRQRSTWRMAFFVMALALMAAGCTSDGSEESEDPAPTESSNESTTPPGSRLPAPGSPDRGLAFQDVYDIPMPEYDPADGLPELLDTGDLIDAGVEAGTWTEAEGVRAVISIMIGELSVEALPALDRMANHAHHGVLERAQTLLAAETLTDGERSDLTRLTSFFFGEPPEDAGRDAGGLAASPVARLVALQAQTNTCSLDEVNLFGAQDSPGTCYNITTNDHGDIVYGPSGDNPGELDPTDQVLDLLERARTGYEQLSGSTLPLIEVLISTRVAPPSTEDPNSRVFAHTLNHSVTPCRIAIFATDNFLVGGVSFELTLAHELFHCIQGTWTGTFTKGADGLSEEGGADYFSYRLIGECDPVLFGRGETLDGHTTHGSLLETDYAGWFFWAFLDERGYLASTGISQLHQVVKAGTQVDQALEQFVPNLPKVINEFYARLVGPGLACKFKGEQTTGGKVVKEKEPIELDAQLFVGTRYELNYEKKRLFEQSDPGGGWIGMAKLADRRSEDAWVVVAKEVRTRCKANEKWIVVVTSLDQSGETREIEVDDVKHAVCDSCLVGNWAVDVDTLDEFYEVSAGIDIEVGGSWTHRIRGRRRERLHGADDRPTRHHPPVRGGVDTPERRRSLRDVRGGRHHADRHGAHRGRHGHRPGFHRSLLRLGRAAQPALHLRRGRVARLERDCLFPGNPEPGHP